MTPEAGIRTPIHRSDWNTRRLKFLLERRGRSICDDDGVVTAFRDGVVTLRANRREDGFTFADKEIGYQGVEPGDLVIHAMDGFAGAIGISDSRGKCSPVYSILTPKPDASIDLRFFAYYLRNLAITGFIESLAKGIRERSTDFRWKDAGNLLVNFPDKEVQKAIADFIDRETAHVDKLIEKKSTMASLVNERWESLLALGVTGRLGNRDPLQETGSPYVPQIPLSWKLPRLKQLASVRGGITLGRSVPAGAPTQEVAYVRVANVQAGQLNLADIAMIVATNSEIRRFSLDKFDVLLNEGGDNDKLGRGAVWLGEVEPCLNQNHVFVAKPHDSSLAQWISHCSNARYGRAFFQLNSKQSTNLASIAKSRAEQFPIPMPLQAEREKILFSIDGAKRRHLATLKPLLTSIERMREFRSALITAAVTGQIDVATWNKQGVTDSRLDKIEEAMQT